MSVHSLFLVTLFSLVLHAEVHTLTLRQAADLAMRQNPDVALARLDEQKALQAVRLAKDPFTPRIVVGSGLAYVNGFPMSIEGSAPSVVQAQATQFLFNRQQSYVVAAAKETARGAGIAAAAKQDEIVFRTASLFLDVERAGGLVEMARRQVESLEKIVRTVALRVQEGQQLPIDEKRASVNAAHARQRGEQIQFDLETGEHGLAVVLGFGAGDRVHAAEERRLPLSPPESEEAAIEIALASNNELKHLQSEMAAKGLELRAQRAARLPRVDLVAQYGLFAKFNHYQDYFRQFQRNNGELGLSFQLPLLPGPGISAQSAQALADEARLRIQMEEARNRITLDIRQSYREVRKADTAREVASQDLDLARDQVSIVLAQMNEGRAGLGQVEEARSAEDEKWIAFHDAQYAAEKARWDVLRQTGTLAAQLQENSPYEAPRRGLDTPYRRTTPVCEGHAGTSIGRGYFDPVR